MPTPAVIATITFLASISLMLLVLTLLEAHSRKQRMRSVTHSPAKPTSEAPLTRARPSPLKIYVIGTLRNITERVSVISGGEARLSATRLRLAGFRDRDALIVYSFLKLVLPFFGAALGYLAVKGLAAPSASSLKVLIYVMAGGLLASKSPDVVLNHFSAKRIAAVRRAFPDMLELLVVTSEAGLSMTPAMLRVSKELNRIGGALSVELSTLAVELGIFSDRQRAWANFEESLPLPEISVFVNTLQQAERYGTPTADALRTLMRDQRAIRLLSVEEKAARIPVLMTLPLIAFIMPSLFVVLIGPAALSIADNIINR